MTTPSLNHEFYDTCRRHANSIAFHRRDADAKPPARGADAPGAAPDGSAKQLHSEPRAELTHAEVLVEVEAFAAGLIELGLNPRGRVALIADNRFNWYVADRAVLLAGGIDVPQPRETAPAALRHVLRHSGARIAIVEGSDNRARIREMARAGELPRLEVVIRFRDDEDADEPDAAEGGPRELGFRDVVDLGRIKRDAAPTTVRTLAEQARGDTIATIVYTSGTTGAPKGVVLTHGNILHNIRVVPDVLEIVPSDRYLSILPAWHMFERTLEYIILNSGASIVYSSKRRIKVDLAEARPTITAFVPRILEMIHGDVARTVASAPAARRLLCRTAFSVAGLRREWRERAADGPSPAGRVGWRVGTFALAPVHRALERLVIRKVRAKLGPSLRLTISGGGALPRHIDAFLNSIGFTVLVGYGLTETAPVVSVRRPEENPVGTIGPPLPETEVEARPLPDDPKRGVLYIRGPQVMRGYFRDRPLTGRVLDDQGWFDSGDLGTVRPDRHIVITGRAKDTIVLRSGENVEPAPIEASILRSPLIEQVMLVGQDAKELAALVVPTDDARSSDTAGALAKTIEDEVRARSGTAAGFKSYESVRRTKLLESPFSVEDGTLTPTLKIRRNVIAERYAVEIDSMGGA